MPEFDGCDAWNDTLSPGRLIEEPKEVDVPPLARQQVAVLEIAIPNAVVIAKVEGDGIDVDPQLAKLTQETARIPISLSRAEPGNTGVDNIQTRVLRKQVRVCTISLERTFEGLAAGSSSSIACNYAAVPTRSRRVTQVKDNKSTVSTRIGGDFGNGHESRFIHVDKAAVCQTLARVLVLLEKVNSISLLGHYLVEREGPSPPGREHPCRRFGQY